MSADGQQVFSLVKDTTSAGSYQSSTLPENDSPNWTLVLNFPDSGTAALWVGSVGAILGGIATVALVGAGAYTVNQARQNATDIAQAAAGAVANSAAFQTLQQLVNRHTGDFDLMRHSLQDIVTALASPR